MVNGCPFIPTAMYASNPEASSSATGSEMVNPSTDLVTTWVAVGFAPTRSRSDASGTPCQRALAARSQPTRLWMHTSAASTSTVPRARSVAKSSWLGWATSPVITSRQVSRRTAGAPKLTSVTWNWSKGVTSGVG